MRKLFTLVAALMMLSASAGSLTVFDGTAINDGTPIYGYNFDSEDYITQTILPEAELMALQGQTITAMKFYVAGEEGNTLNGGKLAVSIGTTTQTSYPSWSPSAIEGLTHVADITMTSGETEIEVTFDTPFVYEGGNLVIETKVVEAGNWANLYFYGVDASVYNVLHKRYATSVDAFYPKTTFTFAGGEEPEVIRGDVDKNGQVTIADVTALIDMLLAGADMIPEADCNLDNQMTIGDVTTLIDYLLNGNW
ncbi:MAG: dockerin type I repeat-containing protein [Muribaculaceae bacterium]|nr:dockerin type I repeat-containing protein [Muribaculaceae bacterium]